MFELRMTNWFGVRFAQFGFLQRNKEGFSVELHRDLFTFGESRQRRQNLRSSKGKKAPTSRHDSYHYN